MIASINQDKDITVYLDNDEVNKVDNETIEGVLIKLHKPQQQKTIYVSVDKEKAHLKQRYEVGVENKFEGKLFIVKLFVSETCYKNLVEKGKIDEKYTTGKVSIFDKSRVQVMDIEQLESYRDNRDKLQAESG